MFKKEEQRKLSEHEQFMRILTNFALAEIKTYTNNLDNALKKHEYEFPKAVQKSVNEAYFDYVNNLRTRAGMPPIAHLKDKEITNIERIKRQVKLNNKQKITKKIIKRLLLREK